MRKVYVDIITELIIQVDDDIEVGEVLSEMDYNFKDTTTKADIIDTKIKDWNITDSK